MRARDFTRGGVDLVAGFEGFRSCPYRDPVGVWTRGYGETRGIRSSSPCVSRGDARAELRRRLEHDFGIAVRRLVKPDLSQRQYEALVSFAYNVGLGAFESSTLLRELNKGTVDGRARAANELLRWNLAGGRVYLGLTRRRKAERRRYLNGSSARVRLRARRLRGR